MKGRPGRRTHRPRTAGRVPDLAGWRTTRGRRRGHRQCEKFFSYRSLKVLAGSRHLSASEVGKSAASNPRVHKPFIYFEIRASVSAQAVTKGQRGETAVT